MGLRLRHIPTHSEPRLTPHRPSYTILPNVALTQHPCFFETLWINNWLYLFVYLLLFLISLFIQRNTSIAVVSGNLHVLRVKNSSNDLPWTSSTELSKHKQLFNPICNSLSIKKIILSNYIFTVSKNRFLDHKLLSKVLVE